MGKIKISFLLVLATLSSIKTWSQIEIKGIKICESVIKNEPINAATSFLNYQGVYCWIHPEMDSPYKNTYITVKWLHEGALEHSYRLRLLFKDLNSRRYRTNSYWDLNYPGDWKVEIYSPQDSLLATTNFRVIEKIKKLSNKNQIGIAPKTID